MDVKEIITLSTELAQKIAPEQAWHYLIVPKDIRLGHADFYIDETKDIGATIEELELLLGVEVTLESKSSEIINKALSSYYRQAKDSSKTKSKGTIGHNPDSFLEELIAEAEIVGSSDIHIEVYEETCRVRFRIDGHLIERYVLKAEDYPALVNKIKIQANLDIAEKRLPQDGRIMFESEGAKFDIRVSVLPTIYGEKVVMRLLSNDATNIQLEQLGFPTTEKETYLKGVKKPHGIILISGPTGSGKTTTLYATLKLLNETSRNVMTVEDPVEYTLEGVNQVQVKESIGFTFASALKSFLRQDPDVIMLGEIRDGETANMAVRAALTGHLVLSTIHTNSAWGTISRLIDMGVPPFLVSNTLNTSVAQRLVRLLCENCKVHKTVNDIDIPDDIEIGNTDNLHAAVGCEECYHTGYKGRTAVYEVLPIDKTFAELVRQGASDVSERMEELGLDSIKSNALKLVEAGKTSVDEAYPLLIT